MAAQAPAYQDAPLSAQQAQTVGYTDAPLPSQGAGLSPEAQALASFLGPEGIAQLKTFKQDPVAVLSRGTKTIWDAYREHGPQTVLRGLHDLVNGQYARGAHEVLTGGGVTAAPMVGTALITAVLADPLTAAAAAGAGTAGQSLATSGARALGATPDQAQLAGDVGAIVGGTAAARYAPQARYALDRVLDARRLTRLSQAADASATDVMRAVPPNTSTPYAPADLLRARPYLEAEHGETPITSVEQLRDAADSSVAQIEDHIDQYIQQFGRDQLRTNPLAAVRSALGQSPRSDFVSRGMAALRSLNLDRPITLEDAERARLQLNYENRAVLQKNHYDLAVARAKDPAFAAREAAAASLREGIYDQLAARGVPGVADLRSDEGALLKIRNAAQRQIYSGEKVVPKSGGGPARQLAGTLTRLVPAPAVVTDPIAAFVRGQPLTRDEMVARAFGRGPFTAPPRYPAAPPPPSIRGLLGVGPPVEGQVVEEGWPEGPEGPAVWGASRPTPPAALLPESTPREVKGLLRKPAVPLGSGADESGGTLRAPQTQIVRDPQTGRFKRIYTGESNP